MRQVCEHYKIVAYLKESAPVNDIHTMAATQIKLLESGAIRHLTYLIHSDYHCANTALTQLVHLALGYAMACRPTTQCGIASSPTSVLCIMRTSKGGDANIQVRPRPVRTRGGVNTSAACCSLFWCFTVNQRRPAMLASDITLNLGIMTVSRFEAVYSITSGINKGSKSGLGTRRACFYAVRAEPQGVKSTHKAGLCCSQRCTTFLHPDVASL
jgi:hypothetical protein